MNFSIQAIIQGLAAPRQHLCCSAQLWRAGVAELRKRGDGRRESGAFLLGINHGHKKEILRFIYYDDLDPNCLDTGIVIFDGARYGALWDLCHETGMSVIADVHTHPGAPFQSNADQKNPMIAVEGHVAVILPNYAMDVVPVTRMGIYEYRGSHKWNQHSGNRAKRFFRIR